MAASTSSTIWADATNTGVASGVTMNRSGSLVITTPGAVISGLDIQGTVYISAPNVTIENCRITSGAWALVQIAKGVTGVTVQNCTINGTGSNNDGSCGISGQGTFLNNNIYNVENGINVVGPSTIENNYIHNLQASGAPHYDGIQVDGGVSNLSIVHNTVINDHGQTSAVMLDNYFGPLSNVTVDNNLLSGGGYTIYVDGQFSGGSISNVSVTNNHMESGGYGVTDFNRTNPVYTGNVNDAAALIATLDTAANNSGGGSSGGGSSLGAPTISSWSSDTGAAGDGITSDNTLTIKGTAVAGGTVKVYDGSTLLGSVTAGSTGAWSFTTSALAAGAHAFKATDTVSGATSAVSSAVNVTIDGVAPPAPVETGQTIVNDNQVKVTGTAAANVAIRLYDGSTVVGTTSSNSSGYWSVTTSALSSGAHSLTATAIDAAGNVSSASAPLTATISAASASGAIEFTGLWKGWSDQAWLRGVADPDSTVNVYDGSAVVGTTTADASGNWRLGTSALDASEPQFLTAKEVNSSGAVVDVSSGMAILGTRGSDVLRSTSGNDVFFGAGSLDTYVFRAGFGEDRISDGGQGDTFYFAKSEFADFGDLLSHASQVGSDTVIASGSDKLTVRDTALSSLTASQFHFI